MKNKLLFALLAAIFTGTLSAQEPLSNPSEVEAMLKGTVLEGIYLSRNSRYSMHFKVDGSLTNQRNEEGKWWVNEQGQYCREWLTGRLTGNKACMSLARDGDQIIFISRGRKVATGTLTKEQ